MKMSVLKETVKSALGAVGLELRRVQKVPMFTPVSGDDGFLDMTPESIELSNKFHNYHLGCGALVVDDYLNVDADFDWLSKDLKSGVVNKIEGSLSACFVKHDLRRGIPAMANTLETVYHSHFLEHLSDDEGRSLLLGCYSCLKPGGVLRMAVPDFNMWCTNYVTNNLAFFDWYRENNLGNNISRYKSKASVFAAMLYNFGHKMAYDFDTLSGILSDIGFINIRQMRWGKSDSVKNIQMLEGSSHRQPESLVVECLKGRVSR